MAGRALFAVLLVASAGDGQATEGGSTPTDNPATGPTDEPAERDDDASGFAALLDGPVEAATRTRTALRKIPNRVYVVTSTDMRRRGYRYLIDVLEDLPGVQVIRNAEAEWGALIFVRGVWQNNKVLVLYNGQKVNSPENRDTYFGDFAWSLHNVKRVEFIYGPASSLYGADAVAGIINIVTEGAEDHADRWVTATAAYGGWRRTLAHRVDTSLATAGTFGPLGVHASGAFHDSGGPRLDQDYPDDYAPFKDPLYRRQGGQDENGEPGGRAAPIFEMPTRSYHLNLHADLGENLEVHYFRWYAAQSSAIGFGVPQFEFSPENTWTFWQDNVALAHALALDANFALRTRVGWNRQELDPDSQFINSFFLNGEAYTREDYKYLRGSRLRLTEELVFHTPDGSLQAILGGRMEDIYSLSKLSTTTGRPFRDRYPASYQTNPATPPAEVNFQGFGLYTQLQWEALVGLDLIGGVSVDKVWYFPWSVNPRAGFTWQAVDDLTVRASYGKAFLTPSPAYMFEGFNNVAFPGEGTIGAVPNTEMEPEDYHTVEIGASITPLTAVVRPSVFDLLLDVSGFYTTNDNYLLRHRVTEPPVEYVPAIGNTEARRIEEDDGAVALFTNENAGEIVVFGADVSLRAQYLEVLDVWVNYSWIDGTMKETPRVSAGEGFDIDYLGNQAQHTVKAGVDVRAGLGLVPALDDLHLVPSIVWYSDYKMRPEPPYDAEGDTLSRPVVLNLSAIYERETFDVFVNVRNLLDEPVHTPGGTVSQVAPTRQPQNRFGFLAGLTARL